MSGAQGSSFGPLNQLFDMGSGQALQRGRDNELLIQQHQQAIGAQEIGMMSQIAGAILSLPAEQRAEAYPRLIGLAQAQGFGKNAPATYPGDEQAKVLLRMGVPPADLYKLQQGGEDAASFDARHGTPPPGATAAPGAGTGTAARPPLTPFRAANLPAGVTPEEDQMVRTVIGEAGGEPLTGQQAVAHVIKTRARLGNQDTQSVIFAPNQFEPWNNPETRARLEAIDPASPQYQQILNSVVRPVVAGQVADPTGGATHFFSPTAQAALGRQPPNWSQGGNHRTTIGRHEFYYPGYAPPSQQQAAPAPVAAPGGAPVQVAAATPTTATDGTTAPVAAPAAATPAATPAPPPAASPGVPPIPPPAEVGADELTAEQRAEVPVLRQAIARGQIHAADADAKLLAYRTANRAAQRQYALDVAARQEKVTADARGDEQLRLSQAADQRAQQEAERKAADAGRPLQGNDVAVQHERILNDLTPKMRDGTATDAEKRLYAGSYYALQQAGGTAVTMDDPNNPGQKIPATLTRRLPPSFPEPDGGALPLVMMNPGAPTKAQMTEGQGQAASFADRMTVANPIMEKLDENALTWSQKIREKAGNFVGYNINSPDYQKLRTVQEAFLAGVLRKESGAAVSAGEWERYAHLYFPMPGDDTETIQLKQKFRQVTLEGMIREAGPNYKPSSAIAAPATPAKVIKLDANGNIIP